MSRFYKAIPLWKDATVFIVAGGPSLKGMDLTPLKGRRTIVVNNAYQLVPSADILFFADSRWWQWHKESLVDWRGRIIATCKMGQAHLDPRILRMNRDYRYEFRSRDPSEIVPLSDEPTALSGPDSGYMAINLAYLLGASRIVLLGYDMGFVEGEAHWHDDHPIPTQAKNYSELFLPCYPALYQMLTKRDVEVVRATPSRLDFIPQVDLTEVSRLPNRRRG